jgi:hypothetical protein
MAKEVLELEVKSNIGEVTKGTKELTNEASSAVGEFRFMGVSLNGVKKAFASAAVTAKGMFGSIKAGLISSGIGAFVVLIGSLIAYFKSTKDGAEKLERAMAGFGAVVSVITDRLSTFGEVIVSAFENPQQAVKDLWEAIKTNIVNRVEGLFDVFGALGDTIKAAFNLDWKGVKAGAADFTESMIQTATGVDDLTGKMAKGFKSLGDEIEKDVAAAMRLKGMLQQLKDEERGQPCTFLQNLSTGLSTGRAGGQGQGRQGRNGHPPLKKLTEIVVILPNKKYLLKSKLQYSL